MDSRFHIQLSVLGRYRLELLFQEVMEAVQLATNQNLPQITTMVYLPHHSPKAALCNNTSRPDMAIIKLDPSSGKSAEYTWENIVMPIEHKGVDTKEGDKDVCLPFPFFYLILNTAELFTLQNRHKIVHGCCHTSRNDFARQFVFGGTIDGDFSTI